MGKAHMVKVTEKPATHRWAVAVGYITLPALHFQLISSNTLSKGNALTVAQLAGIAGAKKTSDLIPLCHPLPLTYVDINFNINKKEQRVEVVTRVECVGSTGVEMEALVAAQAALAGVYDMCKGLGKGGMEISGVKVVEKGGGKSGIWKDEMWEGEEEE